MKQIHICFRIDNPMVISKDYNFFKIGHSNQYFDEKSTIERLNHLSNDCFLPANHQLMGVIDKLKNEKKQLKISFDISGQTLEQFEKHRPDVLESFQGLSKTNSIEFLSSSHSMLFFLLKPNTNHDNKIDDYNKRVFKLLKEDIILQKKLLKKYFNQVPTTFINYGLIYSDLIGNYIYNLGFKAMIAEGSKSVLGWRSPNLLYQSKSNFRLKLLFRNYTYSDQLTFEFGDNNSPNHPLTAESFVENILASDKDANVINLVFDYELFGLQYKKEQGIHDFLYHLPLELLTKKTTLNSPNDIIKKQRPVAKVDVFRISSVSGLEKDGAEWYGNDFQHGIINSVIDMEAKVKRKKNEELLKNWKNLMHPAYYSYMDTQWKSKLNYSQANNPFDSPESAFVTMSNIVNDLSMRVNQKN